MSLKKNFSILFFVIIILFLILYVFYSIFYLKNQQLKLLPIQQAKKDIFNFKKSEYFKDSSKRTESFPFVTGDTFRIISDYVLDEITTSLPDTSFNRSKPIIFVKTDFLSEFLKKYFPKFSNKIILITHNSDYPITKKFITFIENDKLDVWFAQNIEFVHPKLIPIPIGFMNTHFNINYYEILHKYREKTKPWNQRNILLYINFNTATNKKSRDKYISYFEKIKGTKINKKRLGFNAYFEDLNNSKFVLCPKGNGLDTQRYYETVLMGAIPIVESSALDSIYNNSTSLILPSFENLNEKILKNPEVYIKDMNFSKNIIYMEYWLKKIYSFRPNINY